MATVHASTVAVQAASGTVRRLLDATQAALSGAADEIWFRPLIPGRPPAEPALVLLLAGRGVVVLEAGESPGDGARRARDAARILRDRLRPRGVPVAWGVTQDGDRELPEGGAALSPELLVDRDPRRLERALHAMLPERDRPVDGPTREAVRAAVEPQLYFFDLREFDPAREEEAAGDPEPEPAPAAEPGPAPESPRALPGFWLDAKQARIARGLASPRTLVYGPAGSGKTVFLVSRAQYWLARMPEARVLFTCYNASLASHLRHVLQTRGTPPEAGRLTVLHYHQLLQEILGIEEMHERPSTFYTELEPRVLAELGRRDDAPAFDCILVDEGQDFTRRMIEVLVRLAAPGGEITLVCDPAQDIYGRWSRDNLAPMRDVSVERLVDCYRNTAPIYALALSVLPPAIREEMGLDRLEMTRPEDVMRLGPAPGLPSLPGLEDLVTLILDAVARARSVGVSLSDCAVLYTDRRAVPGFEGLLRHSRWQLRDDPAFREPGEEEAGTETGTGSLRPAPDAEAARDPISTGETSHFARALEAELETRGVPTEWVTRDYATKSTYDISRPRLTLSTVHSAKGLDFHTVILLGAESLQEKSGEAGRHDAELLFTGITRARERLLLPYFHDRGWIPGLKRRLEDVALEATHWRGREAP